MSQGFLGIQDDFTVQYGYAVGIINLVKSLDLSNITIVNTNISDSGDDIEGGQIDFTVTPDSMENIQIGCPLLIDTFESGYQETVFVSSVTDTTFTANFALPHTAPYSVTFILSRQLLGLADPNNINNIANVITYSNGNGALLTDSSPASAISYSASSDDMPLSSSPLVLVSILVTTSPTVDVFIYDNASTSSGTIIGAIPSGAPVGYTQALNVSAVNGITVGGNTGNGAFTVLCR